MGVMYDQKILHSFQPGVLHCHFSVIGSFKCCGQNKIYGPVSCDNSHLEISRSQLEGDAFLVLAQLISGRPVLLLISGITGKLVDDLTALVRRCQQHNPAEFRNVL